MRLYKTLALLSIVILSGCVENEKKNKEEPNFLLKKVSSKTSGIKFVNQIIEDPDHSIINYIYYYNGGGVASGDINNDGLIDLYFVSNMGENKLYLNKGNLEFEDISAKAKIKGNSSWNTGVTMVDINNDGLLDIYVCSVSGLLDFKGHNELFINNGDLTFTESSKKYGLDYKGFSTQAYFFDYDKDLDLDLYLVNHAIHTTLSHSKASVRSERAPFTGDILFQNNDGSYKDVSEKANIYGGINGYGLSASLADFNNDGWDDIYVSNDFHEDDYYYINNQDGTFTEDLGSAFSTISRFSMGSDAADINADGFQDLVTLDMLPKEEQVIKESEGDNMMLNMNDKLAKLGYKDQYARNMLQLNSDGKYFKEAALLNNMEATDWSWAPLIADFNNDGAQDLFISNGILRRPNDLDFKNYVSNAFKNRNEKDGMKWLYKSREEMPPGDVSNEIFEGDNKKFKNKTGEWIENKASFSNGAIYTDLDNDGDLDLAINNLNSEASIYENTTDPNFWIQLNFQFTGDNKDGIGTKALVYSGDQTQLKQLFRSRGFVSSVDKRLHFGSKSKIDSIKIIWPNNTFQTLKDFRNNQEMAVSYKENLPVYNYNKKNKESNFEKKSLVSFKHLEDTYNDFHNEKLIPYKVSTLGPAVAVGDIDQNGFEDIFLGNASGKPAKIFLNNGKSFQEKKFSEITKDSLFEDNSAEFFDVDKDGDLDLYVGSGINSDRQKEFEEDRLYLNEGGNFIKTTGIIPSNLLINSDVAAADFDNDGDIDLFVGNKAEAGNFGKEVTSYLLENSGSGKFSISDKLNIQSHVSAINWHDLNNDGYPELIIATEWDQPKIYWNKQGKFETAKIPENLSGLWQDIEIYDIDNDGDKDILLGNWGLNTRFKFENEGGLRMYHSDFNDDGTYETILAYKKKGDFYPIHSRDELASQLNYISKVFPYHENFAMKTVNQISSEKAIQSAKIYEVNQLASGYLENNNGAFNSFIPFPDDFQLAPITSFEIIELEDEPHLLVSGNLLQVNTYHGGYTSLKGFLVKDLNEYYAASRLGIEPFHQQIKATRDLKMQDGKVLIVVPNNAEVQVYHHQ